MDSMVSNLFVIMKGVFMQLVIDTGREYGIVLEGGGARGSYQIGAWKALREAHIKISGIAGASVGALNGALMCMDDLERAETIWNQISYSRVMKVDDELMKWIHDGRLNKIDLKTLAGSAARIVRDRGFDVSPLKNLIAEAVDEDKIRNSARELYITTFSVDDRRELVVDVKNLPQGDIPDALLSSAYFPAFKNEKIGGKRYLDGSSFNNVPVDVLIDQGYRDIIIIRVYGLGFDTEKVVEIPEGVTVSHIAPRQELGGILEFDSKRAKRNMKLGYYDAKRFLYGLAGRMYYFDAPQGEAYYFDKMMSELELIKGHITSDFEAGEAEQLDGYRAFTERIFPALAVELKLKPGWNYKDLYLALLETWARQLRMNRFRIYTPDEVAQKVLVQIRKLDSPFQV